MVQITMTQDSLFPTSTLSIIELVQKSTVFTGIGSRSTPSHVFDLMTLIAEKLSNHGLTLRSGGADGADTAFENGARAGKTKPDIYLPWPGFNNRKYPSSAPMTQAALQLAAEIHPAWNQCSQGARKLHARNTFQILGANLDSPSDFVVFWAPSKKGIVQGGTATAVKLAVSHGIPVFNLSAPLILAGWNRWTKEA